MKARVRSGYACAAVVLAIALALPCLLTALGACHNCQGEHCPYCELALRAACLIIAPLCTLCVPESPARLFFRAYSRAFAGARTPVGLCVRMND